ncbi:MAG: dipeptidase [Bacillota bacterium]|jgi:microsomal dipeptidase-like Zn-dependent dipeptidase
MLKNFYDLIYVADAHADTATSCGDNFYCNDKCHLDLARAAEFLNLQVFAFWEKPRNKPWLEWQSFCRHYADFADAVLGCAGVDILKDKKKLADRESTWAVLAFEGVDSFAWLDDKKYFLDELQKAHFKIVGFFWNNDNWLGCGSDSNEPGKTDLGLNLQGKRFLADFAEYPFIADLAHCSRRSFADICNVYQKPFMVSHACCYGLCRHKRNLSDDQLRLLGERNGFFGVAFYPYFLSGSRDANLDDLTEHIVYAVNLAGEDAVGLGSDFDGVEVLPAGIIGCQSLPRLADKLHAKGFKYNLIEKVMGSNLRNFLAENL